MATSLNQMRAFVSAASTGSFTAAASDLGVSQASVSELVRRLEEEHGLSLYTRGGRRLALTPAGREYLPHAQQAVAAADHGDEALRALRSLGGGTASFGLLRNAEYYHLSELADAFHARYPQVRVRLVGQNSAEVAEAVAAGELEAGLVVLPVDDEGLDVTPLVRDEELYISSDPSRLTRPVGITDLVEAPLVLYDAHYGWRDPTRRQLAVRAQSRGLHLEAQIEVEHVETALSLVARGVGDSFVASAITSSPAFPPGIGSVGFAEPLHDTIALVTGAGRVMSPATREIARMATSMLAGLGLDPAEPQGDPVLPAG